MASIRSKLITIVSQIEKHGKMSFIEGATQDQICSFEKTNKLNLPTQFIEWLLFSDGGNLFLPAGIQLYGVAHKPLIDINDGDRPNENYVVIGRLASGDPILCEINEEKISIYNREAARIESDEIYTDFFSFLNELVELLGIGG